MFLPKSDLYEGRTIHLVSHIASDDCDKLLKTVFPLLEVFLFRQLQIFQNQESSGMEEVIQCLCLLCLKAGVLMGEVKYLIHV